VHYVVPLVYSNASLIHTLCCCYCCTLDSITPLLLPYHRLGICST